jgi:hypothetical protein
MKKTLALLAIVIVVIALIAASFSLYGKQDNGKTTETFVGVTYGGNTISDGEKLIDKVQTYTNLFVLQSGTLQRDLNSVDQLGDYAISKGLYFLPYFTSYIPPSLPQWIDNATKRWGARFLGVYWEDEAGGKMLDDNVQLGRDPATGDSIMKTRYGDIVVQKQDGSVLHFELGGNINLYEPANKPGAMIINRNENTDVYATFYPNGTISAIKYHASDAASNQSLEWSTTTTYQELMSSRPLKDAGEITQRFIQNQNDTQFLKHKTTVFTSDYALYWFDYLAGYDVVLAQIGWNISLAQQIAQARGAASMQNKDWGAIITWKYTTPPYLDSGPEILNQMTTAYECGAKYILLFDYYEDNNSTFGTLQNQHFQAMQDFWNNISKNPHETKGSIKAQASLILPKDYASGLRWSGDKIWGVLEPNQASVQIWNQLQNTLKNYSFRLDIIYDDPEFQANGKYQQTIKWDQTG